MAEYAPHVHRLSPLFLRAPASATPWACATNCFVRNDRIELSLCLTAHRVSKVGVEARKEHTLSIGEVTHTLPVQMKVKQTDSGIVPGFPSSCLVGLDIYRFVAEGLAMAGYPTV